jgi:flagellar motor switch protein FliM
MTLDRIEDGAAISAEEPGLLARIETHAGSMTLHLAFDRQAISALCETAMGGTGTEAAFEIPERPLSRIEKGLVASILAKLATGVVAALSEHLGMPASLFDGTVEMGSEKSGQNLIAFRFVMNVFGYSGEMRLTVPGSELAAQFEAAGEADGAMLIAEEKRASLQREIGKSEVELIIALGPETMLVEEIATLMPGRMVRLAATTSAPVIVSSGGTPVYAATLTRSGEQLAVRIIASAM